MKRTKLFPVVGCACLLILTGCGSDMPDLTKEQSAVIAEYAASLLLKYDTNYEKTLNEVPEEPAELEETPEASEKEPDETENQEPVTGEKEPEGQEPEETAPVYENIQDFYGLTGLEFTFTGYYVAGSYSGQDDSEFAVSFDAAEGNVLAVLEFDVQNVSAEPIALNMLEVNPRFRIQVGETVKKVQPTMLLNDMATFSGTIQPGESICLALVAEYESGAVSQDNSVSLLLRNDSARATILLN